jgi:hypothetical protein
MKRALLIVSICTLLVIGVAVVGQALVVTQRVYYTPSGQPINPTPLALVATYMAGVGGALSFPLCLLTCALGLVVMILHKHCRWVVAVIVAGLLSLVGLFGMAWVLLSVNSPVALATPLCLVVLVILLYSLWPNAGNASRFTTSE